MSRVSKATRVANRAVRDLLDVREGESVLVVADESATADCPEVVEAVVGLATELGDETVLVTMEDVPADVETLPRAVTKAMAETDVLVGLTRTTSASFTHHETPLSLRANGDLRALGMTKRSFEDLTGPAVLDVDFGELAAFAAGIRDVVQAGAEIHVTSDLGTDLRASIDGMPSMSTDVAHDPGDITVIGWGEVYQGPVVGTAEGTVVVDGPVLGYGWPDIPLELTVEGGNVTDVTGDERIAGGLRETIRENENAENLAEIAFGINPHANRRSTSVWKKGRGRTHVGIGNGLIYDQDVDSPVHVDLVLNTASVSVDDEELIRDGEFTATT